MPLRRLNDFAIIFILIIVIKSVRYVNAYCFSGTNCRDCNLFTVGGACQPGIFIRNEYYHCDQRTSRALLDKRAFLECRDGVITQAQCPPFHRFSREIQRCEEIGGQRSIPIIVRGAENGADNALPRSRRSSSSRTGDICNYNTDCQSGMYCVNSVCVCLSDYIAISGYCWPRVNPGDSGCIDDLQCEAVWPGARCSRGGVCECPDYTQSTKTRDGVVCITSGVPPACPLPEPNNPEMPNPATILANAHTHPLAALTYMPVLCTSTSTETERSNGGDGSTWCVYPDSGHADVHIADIYNCVQHPQVRPEFFSEYVPTADGICCHSRAFVCIQPMEPGDEPSVPRWWYNSITGTCTQFLWDPSQTDGVSPNNFRTVEHCESYCRDTCRRGAAQRHNRGTLIDETPIANCLQQSRSCAPEFYCTTIGSHQHCCPTVGHICSAYGGRSTLNVPNERFDAGVPIAGSRTVSRFYYDAEQGKCLSFVYDGLGNYNNFFTKQDCESFCSKLVCEYGNPLRIGEDWQRCERAGDCPHSHYCDAAHKVCCPTTQSICTQPKRYGDCTSSVQRFAYNPATRQCETFQYTGCQGNDNNFDSFLECQRVCRNVAFSVEPKCPKGRAHRDANGDFVKCTLPANGGSTPCPPNFYCVFDGVVHGCCPTKAHTCSLGADRGVQCGAGRSLRFFFNSQRHACESFQFDGCDGNANNFQTLDDCQAYCDVGGCPNGGQPLRDATSGNFATCDFDEHIVCENGHECMNVNVGGDSVATRCCPTKAHICTMPLQLGNACVKTSVTRWYFNIVTRECTRFGFNGCNGNLNNFATRDQCVSFCSSVACALGEITHKDARNKSPTVCTPTVVNSCPLDYRCVFDALTSRHVCCGSPLLNVCPHGEKAYLNALDDSPRECAANVVSACPLDYLCRLSAVYNRYYCCTPLSGNMCPEGRVLHRDSHTRLPTRCTISTKIIDSKAENFCPKGFSCQSSVPDVLQGFCCTVHEVCRNGAEYHIDERTRAATRCAYGTLNGCPTGFRCQRYRASISAASLAVDGYCCRDDSTGYLAADCPPGEFAYTRIDDDGAVVSCDPFNVPDRSCPPKFTCQYAVRFQRYQCCGKELVHVPTLSSPSLSSGCLAGQVAYVQPGIERRPRLCTASAPDACPLGFFCQFSERNAQFQCCAHKGGCPRDTVAYIDTYGRPQACKPDALYTSVNSGGCPSGYVCKKTGQYGAVCCTLTNSNGEHTMTLKITTIDYGTIMKRPAAQYCRRNEKLLKGRCVRRDACRLSSDCPRRARCKRRLCRCRSGSIQRGRLQCANTTLPSKQFNRPNRKTTYRRSKSTSTQSSNMTICGRGYVAHDKRCLRRHAVTLGGVCAVREQCAVDFSLCLSNRCRCIEEYVAYNKTCYANLCDDAQYRVPQTVGALNAGVRCSLTGRGNIAGRACVLPYSCRYSRAALDYICCRKPVFTRSMSSPMRRRNLTTLEASSPRRFSVWHVAESQRRNRRLCTDGNRPLLLHGTAVAVRCGKRDRCPHGYRCEKDICCREVAVTQIKKSSADTSTWTVPSAVNSQEHLLQ